MPAANTRKSGVKTVQANRKLRTLATILATACLALGVLLLRVATVEPPRPIVVRVDEVGRAEAVAYEAATAQADPLDPTTKYFLNRFISDFYSRRQATVEEHWTRSLRFLSTELANAAFTRDGAEVAAMAAGTADTELQVEQVVLRIHPAPEAPHGATADFDLVHLRQGQETLRERWSITLRFTFLTVIPSELVVYNPMGIPHHLPPGRPCPGHGAAQVITHLRGREAALEPFGWTRRQAEWIALACLHSGVFIRAQWSRFLDAHPEQVRRGVHALIAQGAATEETVPGIKGIGRVCRIFARQIYRALGAEDIRHRRAASEAVLMRRLLSLDYVLEHPDLPWLPTRAGEGRRIRGARHRTPAPAPRGSTAEPPVTPGAISRSSCRSRSRPSAPSSCTSIPDTTPRRRYARGAKRTWDSGRRSASAAGPSRSWPSSALSRSSLGPGRYSAAGQKPPARPNRTPGSVKRSTVSSVPSFKARSRSSTSSAAFKPR